VRRVKPIKPVEIPKYPNEKEGKQVVLEERVRAKVNLDLRTKSRGVLSFLKNKRRLGGATFFIPFGKQIQ